MKEVSKQQKLYTILFAWPWGVRKSLFHFSSSNGMGVVCICLQCSRCIQNHDSFLKNRLHTDTCNQLHYKKKLQLLLHLSITGEHLKPNPNSVIQTKVMAANVSTCNLFSVLYSCCTN